MTQLRGAPPRKRPLLPDRLLLRLSDNRRVDGLWIGFGGEKQPEPALGRVEEALRLIKIYDRVRYDRLIRDLERVWVRPLPGAVGAFSYSLGACLLDQRFVLAETSLPEMIAATIVHEATTPGSFDAALVMRKTCGLGWRQSVSAAN